MAMSAVGSKRCAVSSSTSRRHAAISDSSGSRWPAGWLSTSLPSTRSSTNRKRPSRSTTAATVADGFQMSTTFTLGSGGFLRVFLDEFGHPADTGLDRLPGGRIGEPHVLPFTRDARAEVDVGEQCHARLVQQALPELLRILGAHQAAGLGDVRPDVERAAGILALYARHLVQQPDDEVAALLELFFMASATSCGPLIASSAAHWLIWEAQESVLVIQRVKTGASAGLDVRPMRQPVIAQVFEAPSEMIVRSYIPGTCAIEKNCPEYARRE